jgi:hypothetical protein
MKIQFFAMKQGKHLFQEYTSIPHMMENRIGMKIQRTDSNTRKTTPISTKIAITHTLRFLGTGDSYKMSMLLGSVISHPMPAIPI